MSYEESSPSQSDAVMKAAQALHDKVMLQRGDTPIIISGGLIKGKILVAFSRTPAEILPNTYVFEGEIDNIDVSGDNEVQETFPDHNCEIRVVE